MICQGHSTVSLKTTVLLSLQVARAQTGSNVDSRAQVAGILGSMEETAAFAGDFWPLLLAGARVLGCDTAVFVKEI